MDSPFDTGSDKGAGRTLALCKEECTMHKETRAKMANIEPERRD